MIFILNDFDDQSMSCTGSVSLQARTFLFIYYNNESVLTLRTACVEEISQGNMSTVEFPVPLERKSSNCVLLKKRSLKKPGVSQSTSNL